MDFSPLLTTFGAPATGVAVVALLFKLNHTLERQRQDMQKLFHGLDKRVTVLEAKNDV